MKGLVRLYRAWKRRRRADRDMSEEFAIHIEMESASLVREGYSPEEARRRALVAFGGVERHKEHARETQRFAWLDDLARDLGYVVRQVRRDLALTSVIVVTLALGIAANAAVFSLVDGVLLEPLPYREPGRLVVLTGHGYKGELLELKTRATTLDVSAVAPSRPVTLTGQGEPLRVEAAAALPDLFPLLGMHPLAGRSFTSDEGLAGADKVVILSHRLWTRLYGQNLAAVGTEMQLDGSAYRIVGVMPAGFTYPSDTTDVWTPLFIDPGDRIALWSTGVKLVGRLRPHATLDVARAEIRALVPTFRELFPWRMPSEYGRNADVIPLHEHLVGDLRPALTVLLCAVGAVLLIVCINIANLMLVRALARTRELTIRAAIGASRGRLLRQLAAETAAFTGAAACLGLLVAHWATQALKAQLPAGFPRVDDIGTDDRVLLFTCAIAAASAAISGVLPAFRLLRAPANALTDSSRTNLPPRDERRVSRLLVAGQIALATVLAISAALLVKSFRTLVSVDPGFRRDGLVVATVAPPEHRYRTADARRMFVNDLLERARGIPDVTLAAISSAVPFGGASHGSVFSIQGRPDPATGSGEWPWADVRAVISRDYLTAMGIPVAAGRGFTTEDRSGAPLVAIVSRRLADQYWPNEDPLGQRFKFPGDSPWITIVGISGDVKWTDLSAEEGAALYLPSEQATPTSIRLVLRTIGGREQSVSASIRPIVTALDDEAAVSGLRTASDLMSASVERPRLIATLLTLFSAAALLLGAMGVYGLLAYSVSRRTQEIGVRMALGARRMEIVKLIAAQGFTLAAMGAGIGVGLAFLLTRSLGSLLFGVDARDPYVFIAVPVLLLGVALAASCVPAVRGARVDPVSALRAE